MFSRTRSTIRQFAPVVRRMSTNPPPTNKSPKPNNTVRNVVTAVLLLGFVGGVYYTSIAKMRQTDDLTKIIEDEAENAKNAASNAAKDVKNSATNAAKDAKKSVEGALSDAKKSVEGAIKK